MKTESQHGPEGPQTYQPSWTGLHMLEGISLEQGERIELLSNEQGVPQVLIRSRSGITEIKSLAGTASPPLEELLAMSRIVMMQDHEANRDRRNHARGRRVGDRRRNMHARKRQNVGRNS